MRVFSFGASTAQGAKDLAGGGFIGRLGARLQNEKKGHADNFGIGGENTTQMVQRLNALKDLAKTDLAIVTLGINDVPRHPDARPDRRVDLNTHTNHVHTILQFFKDRCEMVYVNQYPVQYAQLGFDPQTVAAYRTAGVDAAQSLGVEVVDIYSQIDDTRFARFIHADGMHFNSEGHQFIADAIWAFIIAES